jgi:hypothetical protein
MPTADEYRSYANQCLCWADKTDNEEHRDAFLDMAKVWTQLAIHGDDMQAQSRSRATAK